MSSTEPQHNIVITRAKLYPVVARPGPAWQVNQQTLHEMGVPSPDWMRLA